MLWSWLKDTLWNDRSNPSWAESILFYITLCTSSRVINMQELSFQLVKLIKNKSWWLFQTIPRQEREARISNTSLLPRSVTFILSLSYFPDVDVETVHFVCDFNPNQLPKMRKMKTFGLLNTQRRNKIWWVQLLNEVHWYFWQDFPFASLCITWAHLLWESK